MTSFMPVRSIRSRNIVTLPSSRDRIRICEGMAMAGQRHGWQPDPFGIHELRYFSQGEPTKLVRDGSDESYDPPPTGSTPSAPAPSQMGASSALVGTAGNTATTTVSQPSTAIGPTLEAPSSEVFWATGPDEFLLQPLSGRDHRRTWPVPYVSRARNQPDDRRKDGCSDLRAVTTLVARRDGTTFDGGSADGDNAFGKHDSVGDPALHDGMGVLSTAVGRATIAVQLGSI